MTRLFGLALLLAGCAATPPPDLRPELEALLAEDAAAWNRGDLEAFVASYLEDALFVSPSGLTEGRAAVLARYQKKYGDAPETMGTLRLEIVAVDPTYDADGAPLSAVVVARWSLAWDDRDPADGLTVLAFRRTPAGWRIVVDASM